MNTTRELWYELFKMWLKSIGVNPNHQGIHATLLHNDIEYRYAIMCGTSTMPPSASTVIASIKRPARRSDDDKWWLGIRNKTKHGASWLELGDVDMHNPSFDPDVFFEPIRQYMMEQQI